MIWTVITDILLVIFVVDCAFMGLVIMMQRSKQEGLGAAFGGGFTDSIWGAQTSNVLVKATVWAASIFFIVSILLARLYSHNANLPTQGSAIQQQLLAPAAIPATTNAAPSAIAPTSSAPPPIAPTSAPASTWVTPTTTAPVKVTTPPAPAKPAGK